jgi:CRISPR-associated protein Cas1
MTDRILDFSQGAASLSIRNNLLIVKQGGVEVASIPCAEIAAVIISHWEVVFTQAVLGRLAESGAAVVICGRSYSPAAMLLPLESHHIQAERFLRQAAMSAPRRKQLWQQIVRAKIAAQASVLEELRNDDHGLRALTKQVRSGDPGNVEARAARRYWSVLFGDAPFARADEEDFRNHWLNYGYAVLRAATARAVCAAGLHPTFGLAHRNKANAFALADDLMEPFRPVVDRIVAFNTLRPLDPEAKRLLIGAVASRYLVDGECRTLFDILARLAQSLVRNIMGESKNLALSEWSPVDAVRAVKKPAIVAEVHSPDDSFRRAAQ